MEVNKFADLSNSEFKYLYLGLNRKHSRPEIQPLGVTSECKDKVKMVDTFPEQFSWRSKAVSDVKNQGMCGSCWAFSAVGALEGLSAIESGKV